MVARVALVTGGNRGIGLEVCRQLGRLGLRVVLAGRDADRASGAAQALAREGMDVRPETLDVSEEASIAACAARLERGGMAVDVLVNSAGIYPEGDLLTMSSTALWDALKTNFLGALFTSRAWVPGMLRRGYGRVVNVSSGYGSLAEGLEGPGAYALSKASLNALTVRLAKEARGDVKVNAVCPGWVRTRMGGPSAPRGVEDGADTIVWLATLDSKGPSGFLHRDRKRIPW